MTAAVDADLFPTTREAIEFVGQRGGGEVRICFPVDPDKPLWKELEELGKKLGVKLVFLDVAVPAC